MDSTYQTSSRGKPGNQKLLELTYEIEEDLAMRDMNPQAKNTQVTVIDYHKYKCIGTESTLKQKSIKKLYIQFLKDLKESKERMDRGITSKVVDASPDKPKETIPMNAL